jgi:hypothetical protein
MEPFFRNKYMQRHYSETEEYSKKSETQYKFMYKILASNEVNEIIRQKKLVLLEYKRLELVKDCIVTEEKLSDTHELVKEEHKSNN